MAVRSTSGGDVAGGLDGRGRRRPDMRPSWLPTTRALVGGAMVATAAAGVLVAHHAADQPPGTQYVVAVAPLPAGQPIRAKDLGVVAAELPDDLGAIPAARATELVGRAMAVSVDPMHLLRDTDVLAPGRFTSGAALEIALDLPPARALAGTLRPGDRVDVLATDAEGAGTTTIATAAFVAEVGDATDGAIGGSGTTRVRVGLPDAATATAVVDAAVRDEITLALPAPGSAAATP